VLQQAVELILQLIASVIVLQLLQMLTLWMLKQIMTKMCLHR